MRPSQQQALSEAHTSYAISLPASGLVPLSDLFPKAEGVALEIGFGAGEHLALQAQARPNWGFIGAEPFVNGVASLAQHVQKNNLHNIRIFADDARLLLAALPPASLQQVFLLFPDPWPKKRHHKRRFLGESTLPLLTKALATGGEFCFATDHPELAEYMHTTMLNAAGFAPHPHTQNGLWAERPQGSATTRYEQKALAGQWHQWFSFIRQ